MNDFELWYLLGYAYGYARKVLPKNTSPILQRVGIIGWQDGNGDQENSEWPDAAFNAGKHWDRGVKYITQVRNPTSTLGAWDAHFYVVGNYDCGKVLKRGKLSWATIKVYNI